MIFSQGRRIVLVLWVYIFTACGYPEEATPPGLERVWTNQTGKTTRGRILRYEKGSVDLQVDGRKFRLPLKTLSPEDREYVESWLNGRTTAEVSDLIVFEESTDFEIRGKQTAGLSVRNHLVQMPVLVFPGQTIRSKQKSISILTSKGNELELSPNSSIRIPPTQAEREKASLEFLRGKLSIRIDREKMRASKKEFRLKTPTALLAVKGTDFFVESGENGERIGVYSGEVTARTDLGKEAIISTSKVASGNDLKISDLPVSKESASLWFNRDIGQWQHQNNSIWWEKTVSYFDDRKEQYRIIDKKDNKVSFYKDNYICTFPPINKNLRKGAEYALYGFVEKGEFNLGKTSRLVAVEIRFLIIGASEGYIGCHTAPDASQIYGGPRFSFQKKPKNSTLDNPRLADESFDVEKKIFIHEGLWQTEILAIPQSNADRMLFCLWFDEDVVKTGEPVQVKVQAWRGYIIK